MRREGKSAVHLAGLVIAVSFCLILVISASQNSVAQSTENSQVKPALSALGYFAGDWECAGKFDSSGKAIETHQRFTSDLDGAWITFRYDNKPPFGYHSLAEWGWDATRKEFLMIAQDSAGGVRVFRSTGWNSTQLQWDGDAFGSDSAPSQRFTFERLDDRHFKVSYFALKGGDWSRVDSSTCSKQ